MRDGRFLFHRGALGYQSELPPRRGHYRAAPHDHNARNDLSLDKVVREALAGGAFFAQYDGLIERAVDGQREIVK
jgi:hypothetical protein